MGTLFIASLEAGKVGDEAADTTRACGQGEPYASRTCNISCFETLVLRCAAGSCTVGPTQLSRASVCMSIGSLLLTLATDRASLAPSIVRSVQKSGHVGQQHSNEW